MKIKDNLDLQGYLLQNFCVDNYDSLDSISNKGDGRMVFLTGNSTDAKYRHVNVWTGTNFKALAYLEDVAMNDDFIALQEKVALLAGDVDTDAIISNMKEVSAFLEGFAEDASLMDYLNTELGKKLDKTGGTIESVGIPLTIKRMNNSYSVISFYGIVDGTSQHLGYLGFSNVGQPMYLTISGSDRALLHSGNVGEYALQYYGTNMPADIVNYVGYGKTETGWKEYGSAISFGISSCYTQIQRRLNTNEYYVRGYDNGTYTDWKTIAFTDSNVASATKLQTARTIWGQSFDGTGNVSGNLNLGTGAVISSCSGTDRLLIDFGGAGDPYFGYGTAGAGISSNICGNNIYLRYGTSRTAGLILNSSGNVGIGTNDPDEKLHVVGNLHVTGNIIADGEVSAGGDGEEGAGNGSGANIYATQIAMNTTSMTVTHNLGTRDVVVSIYERDATSTAEVWNMILTDIEITDANSIRVTFGSATTVVHKVVIFGASA